MVCADARHRLLRILTTVMSSQLRAVSVEEYTYVSKKEFMMTKVLTSIRRHSRLFELQGIYFRLSSSFYQHSFLSLFCLTLLFFVVSTFGILTFKLGVVGGGE